MEPPLAEMSWSRRRWTWTIIAVFAAQMALLVLCQEPTAPQVFPTKADTAFSLVTLPLSDGKIFAARLAGDPTLLVLPGRHEFSGAAWLTNRSTPYTPPEWSEALRWLELDSTLLGKTFLQQAQTNLNQNFIIAETLPPPSETSDWSGLANRNEKPSSLHITGDLAQRPMLTLPKLPAPQHPEPLAETVVQAAVDGAGSVVTARLLSPRAGEPGRSILANQKALEIARTLRFQPVNTGTMSTNLVWGRIIFQWQTTPPPKTNDTNDLLLQLP